MTTEPPVMARDAEVVKRHQARCRRPGCHWTGGYHAGYQDANGERQAHLDWHRAQRTQLTQGEVTP